MKDTAEVIHLQASTVLQVVEAITEGTHQVVNMELQPTNETPFPLHANIFQEMKNLNLFPFLVPLSLSLKIW